MKSAEQFFRDKAFPVGIDDTAWELWKVSHSGIAWQGFAIAAMEEYSQDNNQELRKMLKQAISNIKELDGEGRQFAVQTILDAEKLLG